MGKKSKGAVTHARTKGHPPERKVSGSKVAIRRSPRLLEKKTAAARKAREAIDTDSQSSLQSKNGISGPVPSNHEDDVNDDAVHRFLGFLTPSDHFIIAERELTAGLLLENPHLEAIIESWDLVTLAVRDAVTVLFYRRSLSWENLSPDAKEKLKDWTSNAKEYLDNPEQREIILRACIWHTLDEKLFSINQWMENRKETWAHFGHLTELLKEHGEPWKRSTLGATYTSWKRLSYLLIHDTVKRSPFDEDAIAQNIAHDLGEITGAKDDEIASWATHGLITQIAFHAVTIPDLLLRMTQKFWITWLPEPVGDIGSAGNSRKCWGFPMQSLSGQDSCMETSRNNDEDIQGEPVRLVSRPGLVMDQLERGPPQYTYVTPMLVEVDDKPAGE